MEKAALQIRKNGRFEPHMEVMFNPSSYSVEHSVEYSVAADSLRHRDMLKFTKAGARQLSFELYLDSFNGAGKADRVISAAAGQLKDIFAEKNKDISEQLGKLRELTEPVANGPKEWGMPPVVLFSWGGFSFTGVVTSLRENITMFLADGRPAKAMVTVVMKEYSAGKSSASPDSMMKKASSLVQSASAEDNLEAAKAAVEAAAKTAVTK